MAHDSEQPPAGRKNRLSVRQVVVDWLMPAAAIVEFIEWVVTTVWR
ncbi:hypothetical protein ABZ946_34060 [Streptomyces sp. NPDC046324]